MIDSICLSSAFILGFYLTFKPSQERKAEVSSRDQAALVTGLFKPELSVARYRAGFPFKKFHLSMYI